MTYKQARTFYSISADRWTVEKDTLVYRSKKKVGNGVFSDTVNYHITMSFIDYWRYRLSLGKLKGSAQYESFADAIQLEIDERRKQVQEEIKEALAANPYLKGK